MSNRALSSTKLPSEKPLPSLPIARVSKGNSIREGHSLIDALERPLRRSPPGMPHKQEEWPVLSPQKLTTAGTGRKTLHNDTPPASPNTVSISSTQNERYPLFGRNPPPNIVRDRKFATIAPSSHNIPRKEAPCTKSCDALVTAIPPAGSLTPVKQPISNDKVSNQVSSVIIGEPASFTAVSELSAGAAAIEKAAHETKSIGQPRQTRTSSLRARLSAGKVVKGDPAAKTKVMGFTDFTAVDAVLGKTSKDNLRDPEGARARPQRQSVTNLNRKQLSEAPLRANRAPAQFVGGSRRPMSHRPSSRGSVRNEPRATTPIPTTQPPTQPMPAIPLSSELPEPTKILNFEVSNNAEPKRSSIPIFRHTVSNMVFPAEDEKLPTNKKQEDSFQVRDISRNKFEIFEDRATESLSETSNGLSIDQLVVGQHEEIPTSTSELCSIPGLQVIEESPRQDYHIKRLSVISPEYGPTLRISPSADRLIMGSRSDKDKRSSISKMLNSEHRGFGIRNLQEKMNGAETMVNLKKPRQRPASSQGLPQFVSTPDFVNQELREKKVKSVELTNSPTNHIHEDSAKLKPLTIRRSTEVSVIDDPFFDAQSTNDQDQSNHHDQSNHQDQSNETTSNILDTMPAGDEETLTIDEESWISPIHYKKKGASNGSICLNTSNSTPKILQDPNSKDSDTDRKSSTAATSVQEDVNIVQPLSDLQKREENVSTNFPSTPERSSSAAYACNSASFPPRSSSRTTAPDYTVKRSTKSSPISPLDVERCHQQFLERQNQLGASRGHASCPLDISQGALSKRDSIARESSKSQGSISKGMLSNIRGLFHKRSAESELYFSSRSNRKGKQYTSIRCGGSPFPPISEIHPIHRPTLASSNRSNAIGRKPVGSSTIANMPITPTISSPLPSEISATTALAMQLLESARTERSSPKKERALELGTILVEAITQARNAEKAMEEAKHAARKAEVAHALCKKSVGDIAKKVLEWKDNLNE